MSRLYLTVLLVMLWQYAFGRENDDVEIRRFVGQWKGNYTVSSLTGENLGNFKMEQSYYWHEGHLLGATAIQMPDSSIQYEYSEVWHDGEIFRSIVENDHNRQHYYGWKTTRTIWWQSHYDSRATFHQLHTEKLEPTPAGFQLTMDGYQWTAFSRVSQFLHFRAELIRLNPGESFNFLETLPE